MMSVCFIPFMYMCACVRASTWRPAEGVGWRVGPDSHTCILPVVTLVGCTSGNVGDHR